MTSIHEGQEVLTAGIELEEAEKAVIMVHGRGATAQSVLQLSSRLPEAAYLAPQAAKRTWYPRSFMEERQKNQPFLDSALSKLDSLVRKAAEKVGRENVFVLGFSQGACLASEYVASNPERYGGLIVLSGGLIGKELGSYSGSLENTPVFIGCAEKDPHIPVERVDETAEKFEQLGADLEKYVFEGSHHGIVDYEVEAARKIIGSKTG